MILPFVQPQPSPIAGMLVQGFRNQREQQKLAMEQFLKGRQLNIEQQRADAYRDFMQSQERRADVQEKRESRMAEKQQKQDVANAIPQITTLLDPNSPTFNPALAKSIGQIHGITFDQKLPELPPMPGAAPQRPQPLIGPVDSPEHASELAQQEAMSQPAVSGEDPLAAIQGAGDTAAQEAIRQRQEQDTFRQDLAQFDQRQREHADQLAAYQEAKRRAEQNPVYEGTSPLGPVRFAPTATQQGKDTAAMGIADRVAGFAETLKATDPARANRLQMLSGAAKARLLPEDKVMAMLQQELSRDAQVQVATDANKSRERAAAMRRRSGSGSDGEKFQTLSTIAQYLVDNPGDYPGAYRLAERTNVDPKEVGKVISQAKGTESQTRDAQQATVGLRAIDEIEASGYKPNRAEIQQWMNNQKWVRAAESDSAKSLFAMGGQTFGLLPQSETEGLSPEAQNYFANVRRYIETIGRKQSGAAISPMEWTNFFNQFGPNSKGGLKAARQYLNDQMRSSGIAGRQLGADDNRGASSADSEAIGWARKNPKDPRAKAILQANGLQ